MHMASTFTTSTPLGSPPADALQSALATLTNNGFAISRRGADFATVTGPGLYSTKQNPILGASRVELQIDNDTLHVQAELGGVDSIQRFLIWFPFLLGLGLGVVFTVVGGIVFGQKYEVGFGVPWAQGWRWVVAAMAFAMLPVTPWLFLSPLTTKIIRKRTQRALETLAGNAAFPAKYL